MLEMQPVVFSSNTHAYTHTRTQCTHTAPLETTSVLVNNVTSTGLTFETTGIGRQWQNLSGIKPSPYQGLQSPACPSPGCLSNFTFHPSPHVAAILASFLVPKHAKGITTSGPLHWRDVYIHNIKRVCVEDNVQKMKREVIFGEIS